MICRHLQASGARVEGGVGTGSRTSLAVASLPTALAPGRSQVVDLEARPGIEHLVALSDVVEVSEEDLRWLDRTVRVGRRSPVNHTHRCSRRREPHR
jgi:hypothetical protein